MRRALTATLVALLAVGLLPPPAFAAAPTASAVTADEGVEDQDYVITLRAESADDLDVTAFSPGSASHGSLGSVGAINCDSGAPKVCTADVTYTPDANYFGPDSFTYTATTDAESGAATVSITVAAVNDVPSFTKGANVEVAKGAGAVTRSGWATAISPGPLESDAVTFIVDADDPSLFSAGPAISSTGTLTFTPAGTAGSTSVDVSLEDDGTPQLTSNVQTFTITLSDGPTADAKGLVVAEDSSANPITLSGTDPESDPLTFAIVSGPSHGQLGGTGASRTYTPAANYFGPDSFTYTASDGSTTSPAATVSITVTPVNDPVDARNDAVSIKATTTTKLDLFKANGGSADSAGPGESATALTITAVTKPSKGSVAITDGGKTVTYDPTACSYGSDLFSYTISDGEFTDTASVVVTINRPGQGGVSTSPITDVPTSTFVTNSTMSSTVPVKLAWCGVTTSSSSVRNYKVQQSANAGTYSTILPATTARSSTRALSVNTNYRWRARTVDTAGRTGSYRYSTVARITRYQNTSTAISYTGSWGTSTAGSPSGGSQRYTSTADASASITVTNRSRFAIVGAKSSIRGSFRVYVDNVLVATVSAKTSSTTVNYRRVLYHRALTSGAGVSHTIRIEAVGNGRVDLDAILTLGTP